MDFLKRLFIHKSNHAGVQFVRYLCVAVVALGVDFGGLVLLKEVFHLNYLLAATLSFLGGLIVNYYLSIWWAFSQSKLDQRHKEFLIFGGIGLAGLGVNDLMMFILTTKLGLFYVLSKMITTGVVFFWNFFARKLILF